MRNASKTLASLAILAAIAVGDQAWARPCRRIALIPPVDRPAVAKAVEEAGCRLGFETKVLGPDELASSEFNATNYPVAVYLGSERYLYQIHEPGDATDALLDYLAGSGFLLVGGFVWPFYAPMAWTDEGMVPVEATPSAHWDFGRDVRPPPEVLAGQTPDRSFGLPLGLWIGGEDTTQFESPPEEVRFNRVSDLLPHLPDFLSFSASDPRYRPCSPRASRKVAICEPIVTLVGASGQDYGPGITYIEHAESYLPGGKVLYVWGGLLEGSDAQTILRDSLVLALGEALSPDEILEAGALLDEIAAQRNRLARAMDLLESLRFHPSAPYLRGMGSDLASDVDQVQDLCKVGQIKRGELERSKIESDLRVLEARLKGISKKDARQRSREQREGRD